ncbi:pirin family protein [Pedobacter gandavensis]|uniref:Pirin family protein n=1 Tax=Pedobacter gandavensis TaxID=2679963 RepID=A0ABR6EVB3_9SPHI|nr:pirin family protein [Pedobacter gandavensis]MBB2148906.1 pirin family protein [Pedobacter gandavensis]
MKKKIAGIYNSNYKHAVGDAFKVINIFPNGNNLGDKMSPFYMIDYQPETYYEPSDKKRGVNVHPHRGIEPVTLVYQGAVSHSDSAGHHGIVGPGDVQWMTAGKGILHKEYFEEEFSRKGGNLQMIQVWTILPKAYKYVEPGYQTLLKEEIKKVTLEDGEVRIIAGSYQGVESPVRTYSPMNLLDVTLNAGAGMKIDCPATYNMGILILEGQLKLNDVEAGKEQFVLFENEGEVLEILAIEKAKFLILNGKPLNEPAVHKGPFVMNTQEEIDQAFADVAAGKFGYLENEEV